MNARTCWLFVIAMFAYVNGVTVYRNSHYVTKTTANVTYTKTLVHCTDQTDQHTCTETEMLLDVWQPTNSTGGPFPIVMTVHGGAFVSGDAEMVDPPNAYFAERGFVAFAVQYRLAKDKGLYPKALRRWSPKTTQPKAHWTPFAQTMYPAVRDIKAALRWIHAHASEYNADISSLTLQGGSAGATAVIELALTGGDSTFAADYTGELSSTEDRTLATANLDQPATATGLIDYWGAIFTEDLMHYKDGKHRWSASSLPTIAFHGTDDTTVSPATGRVLCGNLTALGVPCQLVSLPGQKHGCWNAKVALPSGKSASIFNYAFDWMAKISNWTVIDAPPAPPPVTNAHYEDPAAGGCKSDEKAVNITGIAGGFCSPSCASSSCPTDRPAGVTARVTCTPQKNCALVCDPSVDAGRAGCGPAGNNMSCKPTTTTHMRMSEAQCCWSKWGDKSTCGGYPSGKHGGFCSSNWSQSCTSSGSCPAQPVPPPAPPTPTPPSPPSPSQPGYCTYND